MSLVKKISLMLRAAVPALALCLCSGRAVYAADAYLNAIEAEAADTGAVSKPVSATVVSKEKKVRHALADKIIEPDLSFDEFEGVLDSRYSGSNSLYVKLSRSKRKSVYRGYQNDNRISSVREEIVRLLTSG
jgi:hypothetical protein